MNKATFIVAAFIIVQVKLAVSHFHGNDLMSELIKTRTIRACLFALVLIAAYVSPIAGLTIAVRLIIVVAASVLAGLMLGLFATGVTITVVTGLAVVAELTNGHPLSVGAMIRDATFLAVVQTVAIVTGYKLRSLLRYTSTRRS